MAAPEGGEQLQSNAEKLAINAMGLAAFADFNLLGVKTNVARLLSLFGRDGFFSEYTRHDISHINKMLEILDWLIPSDVADAMSPADWLLVVLSIYFHDIGLLITKDEYERRSKSGFPEFRDTTLYSGDEGANYRARLDELESDDREKFLYQEYVRAHHAHRIGKWIRAETATLIGGGDIASEVDRLLAQLPATFRVDLANVCESHHSNDLADLTKYPVSQPYGDSDAETANVQYAALVLRLADLLHITQDRAPSVMFRAINPADPISQREWAKQASVRRVRSQLGKNREGLPDERAPRDTIEVFATFDSIEGFFGLTAYLAYTRDQLRKIHDWSEYARRNGATHYRLPWRFIDDTGVESKGFLPQSFSFTLDQERILELLTGHTLYNDTNVVLRELVQNALDAVRLQALLDRTDPETSGLIEVEWDGESRILRVRDNGTGMTQEVIEHHLLKVGASRYQSDDFRRAHPDFSPISQFGIGVLSTFMLADAVEIVTCTLEEEQARHLTLRSVHGRYLIRLLEKDVDPAVKRLQPHGTEFTLYVRATAEIDDIAEVLRRWVVIPRCRVVARRSDAAEVIIGYESPRMALEDYVKRSRYGLSDVEPVDGEVRIAERTEDDITVAYALVWREFFREWNYFTLSEYEFEEVRPWIGTCIEGIRVEGTSPGYQDEHLLALANAVGPTAPKTNVARSALEPTPERRAMLGAVYRAYAAHAADELHALQGRRSFSLTWAGHEAQWLIEPLVRSARRTRADVEVAISPHLLRAALAEFPLVLIERDGVRQIVPGSSVMNGARVWMIDSALFRSAESLLREIPGQASVATLAGAVDTTRLTLPSEPILCEFRHHYGDYLVDAILDPREVTSIHIHQDERRVDLGWSRQGSAATWLELPSSRSRVVVPRRAALHIARRAIDVSGRDSYVGVRAFGIMYLFCDSPLATHLLDLADQKVDPESLSIFADISERFIVSRARPSSVEELLEFMDIDRSARRFRDVDAETQLNEFLAALRATSPLVFDTWAWRRDGVLGDM